MSFRNTIGLIGAFLAVFWVFGLIIALDRTRVEEAILMPSLKTANQYEIDSVLVRRAGQGNATTDFYFTRKGSQWYLSQGASDPKAIKVDAARVRNLIREVKDVKRDTETTVPSNPAAYGLAPPKATITLTGHRKKKGEDDAKDDGKDLKTEGAAREWQLFLGNESPDKKFLYVGSPDFPGRVFAVPQASLSAALFKSAADLRSKRLFDFSEPSVQALAVKRGDQEIEIKKTPGGAWLITKPNLGYADYEGAPTPKEGAKESVPDAKSKDAGVKGLIAAIANIRVDADDDFVTPAADTLTKNGLTAGQEKIQIRVLSGDEKSPTDETLLLGREEGGYVYGRLATDDGTFKLKAETLAPILAALGSPKTLRSPDLSPITIKDADAITLTQGKDEARFLKVDKGWAIDLPGEKRTPANEKVVESLLEALQGKRDIAAFKDVPEAEAAKTDAELGFDAPYASASVYLNAVDTGKKSEASLKKDAKPAETWVFGKTDDAKVWVKRTLTEGPVTRFQIKKSTLDRIVPSEGTIGFIEPYLPKFDPKNVVKIDIDRGAGKTVSLVKSGDRWLLKDAAGDVPADPKKVADMLRTYSALQVRKWVKKLDAKDDLEPFGLKTPGLSITFTTKKDELTAQALGSAIGQLGGVLGDPALAALGAAWGNVKLAGDTIVTKFGKSADKDDMGNLYVQNSQTDRLSLVPDILTTPLRETDFRDRWNVLGFQVDLAALAIGSPASQFANGYLNANPAITGQIGVAEISQVKQLVLAIRTPIEQRVFTFNRTDKGWTDASALRDFQLDADRVNDVAKLVAQLGVNRVVMLTGGPKADHKLGSDQATLIIQATFANGTTKTVATGANFEGLGYFTVTSDWPGAVFLLNPERVQPILRGAEYFAKTRTAAN